MISAATRLSAQPNTTAVGFCAVARLARSSMLWLGCSGWPATNRSLPSLSAFHAVTGFVLGMADIVPEYAAVIDSRQLSRWYEHAQRNLPWRRPGVTPWQILVSEFMLQQTPVARVEPIWLAWVARWPTPSATAAASAADVLRAWGKLGYPRRAKRLHECATVIADLVRRCGAVGRRNAVDAAGDRRLHRPRGRLFRVPAAGARRRHQRTPRGRQGRARQGRRGGILVTARSRRRRCVVAQ